VTAAAATVKLAPTAPLGIVTLAGTVTAALLLASATTTPPAGAATRSVTAQLSVPEPVIDALLHESDVKEGVEDPPPEPEVPLPGPVAAPVPVRLITIVFPPF
jgi:hypothetical protein